MNNDNLNYFLGYEFDINQEPIIKERILTIYDLIMERYFDERDDVLARKLVKFIDKDIEFYLVDKTYMKSCEKLSVEEKWPILLRMLYRQLMADFTMQQVRNFRAGY